MFKNDECRIIVKIYSLHPYYFLVSSLLDHFDCRTLSITMAFLHLIVQDCVRELVFVVCCCFFVLFCWFFFFFFFFFGCFFFVRMSCSLLGLVVLFCLGFFCWVFFCLGLFILFCCFVSFFFFFFVFFVLSQTNVLYPIVCSEDQQNFFL